jgi:hypothetical protein
MLGWPCFMNYVCNNQHDALFILILLNYYTYTCLGRINSPSSGDRMYICGKWYLLYCAVDCQRAWLTVSLTMLAIVIRTTEDINWQQKNLHHPQCIHQYWTKWLQLTNNAAVQTAETNADLSTQGCWSRGSSPIGILLTTIVMIMMMMMTFSGMQRPLWYGGRARRRILGNKFKDFPATGKETNTLLDLCRQFQAPVRESNADSFCKI